MAGTGADTSTHKRGVRTIGQSMGGRRQGTHLTGAGEGAMATANARVTSCSPEPDWHTASADTRSAAAFTASARARRRATRCCHRSHAAARGEGEGHTALGSSSNHGGGQRTVPKTPHVRTASVSCRCRHVCSSLCSGDLQPGAQTGSGAAAGEGFAVGSRQAPTSHEPTPTPQRRSNDSHQRAPSMQVQLRAVSRGQ